MAINSFKTFSNKNTFGYIILLNTQLNDFKWNGKHVIITILEPTRYLALNMQRLYLYGRWHGNINITINLILILNIIITTVMLL